MLASVHRRDGPRSSRLLRQGENQLPKLTLDASQSGLFWRVLSDGSGSKNCQVDITHL